MKDKIKQIVSEVYGVDMTNRTRDRRFVEARQAFCYFCRLMTILGLDEIGEAVGINHSTVTYGAKHYGEILHYPDVNERYEAIKVRLINEKPQDNGMQDQKEKQGD